MRIFNGFIVCAAVAFFVGIQAPVAGQADKAGKAGAKGAPKGGGTQILQQAPTDKAVPIPLETLKKYFADMDSKKQQTLRMLEGGRYNVNIRRITDAETGLVHPVTADVWVILEGGGTVTTGGRLEGGKIIGGESHTVKVGDVEFIPAGLPHGVSGVTGSITWLNIRFDTNYDAK
jgi:mannose-6-phosphate isomerase-like protein (cupin superfamily)